VKIDWRFCVMARLNSLLKNEARKAKGFTPGIPSRKQSQTIVVIPEFL
jgi:hypothetical protein